MAETVHRCRLCGMKFTAPPLDLGAIPVSNRFTQQAELAECYRLAMTACTGCGLVQLAEHAPLEAIVPRIPWLRYREPETHLDDLVTRLPAVGKVIGLGPFDAPLIDRLMGCGPQRVDRKGAETGEVDAKGRYPYLETAQVLLRADNMAQVVREMGSIDLVVLRYLLEHCYDPVASLVAIKQLLPRGGAGLLIEVPDSTKFLRRRDYSFIWEEHI